MKPDEPTRPQGGGARVASLLGFGVFSLAVFAACSGENLFTGPVSGGTLLGPEVQITAPQPDITLAVGDSVRVTASMTSSSGITEVSFKGNLDAGGEALTTITFTLPSPQDTTVSRYMKRSGVDAVGDASIIVTATDVLGDMGADTVSIVLGG